MSRIIVTGAAGFIGSNLVRALNARGQTDILAVDDLTDGDKFLNLSDLTIADYLDTGEFYDAFADGAFGPVDAVLHQGACSDTTVRDGKFMLRNNYTTSVQLFQACQRRGVRLIYASSAATYGGSSRFCEVPDCELPLNVYGYSKLLFDQRMRRECGSDFQRVRSGALMQVVGLRYFNVYGPREQHKGRMASVAFHQFHQFQQQNRVRLFAEYGGYAAGAQERDFVHVDDVVAINLWFLDHPDRNGIFNVGTGRAQTFNELAATVVNTLREHQSLVALPLPELVRQGLIEYIPFPQDLHGRYQCHTQADLTALRAAGCTHAFTDVQDGVGRYMRHLVGNRASTMVP